MRIDITALRQGPNCLDSSQDADSLGIPRDDAALAGPVKVSLELNVTGEDIRIDGGVSTVVEEECSRCLESYKRDLEAELHLYAIGSRSRGARPEPEDDQGEGMLIHDGRQLDLSDEVRSAILLSIPMQPLCSPECKGLCPGCGANLNQGQCNCGHRAIDPRWKGLEKLRGQ
jgi:uncharacterized protein